MTSCSRTLKTFTVRRSAVEINSCFIDRVVDLLDSFNLIATEDGLDDFPQSRPTSPLEDLNPTQLSATLESLLYICGALKFLVASPTTKEVFLTPLLVRSLSGIHGALERFSRDLDSRSCSVTTGDDERGNLAENVYHVLLQVGV